MGTIGMERDQLLEHKKRVKEAAYKYVEEYNWILVPTVIGSPTSHIHYKQWRLPSTHPEYQPPPSPEEMLAWFDESPPISVLDKRPVEFFDIAAVTGSMSGIVVVDADSKEAATEARMLGLTSPVVVQSRRGYHYYWLNNDAVDQRNKVGEFPGQKGDWPHIIGLDLRANGGVIRLPPSYCSDKLNKYVWINDFSEIQDDKNYTWKAIERGTFTPPSKQKFSEQEIAELRKNNVLVVDFTGINLGDRESTISMIESGVPVKVGSRNHTVTAIVGELVAKRYPVDKISDRVHELMALPNWQHPLEEEEVQRTIDSIISRDKLQNPESWDGDDYKAVPQQVEEVTAVVEHRPKLQPLITAPKLDELREQIGDQKFIMYPAVTLPAICQVYGYSGHGKSLFTAHMLYAAVCGKDFGVFENRKKTRVLYLDFENSLNEILERMEMLHNIYCDDDDSGFAVYSPAMKGGSVLTLDTEQGLKEVLANAESHKAEVIVIDTYRTAFNGFSENDSHQWATINRAILVLRNAGYAVIGLHHANKASSTQGKNGTVTQLGSEAGSTAQLNLLEVQMRVTQIYPDTDAGNEEAEETRGVVDEKGYEALLKAKRKREEMYNEEYYIRTAIKVSYGKVRNRTPAHRSSYIGFAEAPDGTPVVIASTPLRKRVQYLLENGKPKMLIASEYNLPMHLIDEWDKEKIEKNNVSELLHI